MQEERKKAAMTETCPAVAVPHPFHINFFADPRLGAADLQDWHPASKPVSGIQGRF